MCNHRNASIIGVRAQPLFRRLVNDPSSIKHTCACTGEAKRVPVICKQFFCVALNNSGCSTNRKGSHHRSRAVQTTHKA